MKRRRKVFLPRWYRVAIIPLLVLVWIWVTYEGLIAPNPEDQLSVLGWLVLTAMFLGIGLMIWLQSSGKLPVYEIEMDDEGTEGAGGAAPKR